VIELFFSNETMFMIHRRAADIVYLATVHQYAYFISNHITYIHLSICKHHLRNRQSDYMTFSLLDRASSDVQKGILFSLLRLLYRNTPHFRKVKPNILYVLLAAELFCSFTRDMNSHIYMTGATFRKSVSRRRMKVWMTFVPISYTLYQCLKL
jgi:hypothetical protein